jgi:hypothetical protein
MPANHLAKTVGIYGSTTPGAGLHYAAGYRRPMVPALCSAERVSRRLRPLIESGAVIPPSVSSEPKSKGTLRHRLARLHRSEAPTLPNPAQPTRPAARTDDALALPTVFAFMAMACWDRTHEIAILALRQHPWTAGASTAKGLR